jgi:hypothetical protein
MSGRDYSLGLSIMTPYSEPKARCIALTDDVRLKNC